MTDNPEVEPIFFVANEAIGCIDYRDEYRATLTSFGPTPNRVHQYLRKRFVFTLAEVMKLGIPLPLLSSVEGKDADRVGIELRSLGAEVRVECVPGGPISESYPEVRVPFYRQIE